LLVLATCREEEVGPEQPLAAAVDALVRERLATRLRLERLDRQGTAAVLAALAGQAAVSDSLVDAVYRETEGNPLFIEETMKALVEQGVIARRDGKWFRDETAEIRLPEGVRSVIARRLERLAEPSRDALHTAAALGKVFRFDELLAVSGMGEDALLDALDEARRTQLVSELADERFAFTHDKIREVLYTDLSPIRRRRLHRQVGERLLKHLAAAAATRPETLAHHFHLGAITSPLSNGASAPRNRRSASTPTAKP
jgi:predicted ATPase